jgi:hypothetical protein
MINRPINLKKALKTVYSQLVKKIIDRSINLIKPETVKLKYQILFYTTYYLLLVNTNVKTIASITFEVKRYIELSLFSIKFLYLKRIKRQSKILSLTLNEEKLLIVKKRPCR